MTAPSRDRNRRDTERLRRELKDIRRRLEEAESTIAAIRAGEVDAVIVAAEREAVYTLEHADRPYRLLVEHKRDPAAVLSCDGEIIACNRNFARLLDQPVESLIGTPIGEYLAPERRADVAALLRAAREDTAEASVELRRADGELLPAYWNVSLLRGGAAGECLVVTDVTERKLFEERRYRSEQFESLVNDAPIGIFLLDHDFRVIQINSIAARFFPGVPGGVVGWDFDQVMHLVAPKEHADEVVSVFRRTLATGESFETPEPQPLIRNGRHVGYFERRLNRITLPDGRLGLVCYMNDVTAHVETREALESADRRKDEFLAILAHELRNPLAPMRNALAVLEAAPGDSETAARARHTLARQVEQMTRLVDDLVDVNRIGRGVVELRKTILELSAIVEQAVATCRPVAERAQQQIVVTLPPEPVYLNGDPVRLAQILYNLLHNACKFTPAGGRIDVVAQRQEGDVVLSVRDTGRGISADMLDKVFEMFSQVPGPQEESQGGLGIGLTLVKRLAELHGGTVTVRSEGLGKGSEFVIRLPIVTDEAPQRPRPSAPAAAPGPKRRVLVVDDNRDNAESLALLLQMHGHDTHVAADGETAIGAAEQYEPDVILLDIGLPKLNGYEACRRIRAHPWGRRATIFALTGWGQEDDRRKSREAGFDGHFVKPVDHDALLAALARARANDQ